MKKIVTINSRDYDGELRKSWTAELLEQSDELLSLVGVFDFEVDHAHLGLIRRGTISYEYYWLNRWYSVFRFHGPDGTFRNFYCNINMMPVFDGAVLDYADLELDLIIDANGNVTLLDEDEFERTAARFNFSEETLKQARAAVKALRHLIEQRKFPFDYLKTLEPIAG